MSEVPVWLKAIFLPCALFIASCAALISFHKDICGVFSFDVEDCLGTSCKFIECTEESRDIAKIRSIRDMAEAKALRIAKESYAKSNSNDTDLVSRMDNELFVHTDTFAAVNRLVPAAHAFNSRNGKVVTGLIIVSLLALGFAWYFAVRPATIPSGTSKHMKKAANKVRRSVAKASQTTRQLPSGASKTAPP